MADTSNKIDMFEKMLIASEDYIIELKSKINKAADIVDEALAIPRSKETYMTYLAMVKQCFT